MTEAELCDAFREAAEADGWIVYPEVAGWDLVLVWSGDAPIPEGAIQVEPGDQVAVEAKLRANVQALNQAATRTRHSRGAPDFRAVLAPKIGSDFQNVANLLGVGCFSLRHCGPWSYRRGYERDRKTVAAPRRRHTVERRLWLPPVVSAKSAGEPSPQVLTPWRVKALKMVILIQDRGHCTREDFRTMGISPEIWVQQKWIIPKGRFGRLSRYVLNPDETRPLPHHGWKAELEAIRDSMV